MPYMNLPTLIIALIIAAVFIAIVVNGLRRRKKGKHACSCGECGSCGLCSGK